MAKYRIDLFFLQPCYLTNISGPCIEFRGKIEGMNEDTLQLLILTALLLLYMIIGAGVFSVLELENEARLKQHYYSIFDEFAKRNNLSSTALSTLLSSQKDACMLGVNVGQYNKWDFTGSFYFTGTVITTIGKLHISLSAEPFISMPRTITVL